jgi:2'-5' RNA ligase superfamily protein
MRTPITNDNSENRWSKPTAESALVVLIPEADNLLRAFRDRYDPAAAAGMPAHVTILYPFKSPVELLPAITDELRTLGISNKAFGYSFSELRRFPGVLYLAPDDSERFRKLTFSVWKSFPETPPYGGKHTDIIPHLTVAQIDDAERLDDVEKEVEAEIREKLPLRGMASELALMDNESGHWRVRIKFRLSAD